MTGWGHWSRLKTREPRFKGDEVGQTGMRPGRTGGRLDEALSTQHSAVLEWCWAGVLESSWSPWSPWSSWLAGGPWTMMRDVGRANAAAADLGGMRSLCMYTHCNMYNYHVHTCHCNFRDIVHTHTYIQASHCMYIHTFSLHTVGTYLLYAQCTYA